MRRKKETKGTVAAQCLELKKGPRRWEFGIPGYHEKFESRSKRDFEVGKWYHIVFRHSDRRCRVFGEGVPNVTDVEF